MGMGAANSPFCGGKGALNPPFDNGGGIIGFLKPSSLAVPFVFGFLGADTLLLLSTTGGFDVF